MSASASPSAKTVSSCCAPGDLATLCISCARNSLICDYRKDKSQADDNTMTENIRPIDAGVNMVGILSYRLLCFLLRNFLYGNLFIKSHLQILTLNTNRNHNVSSNKHANAHNGISSQRTSSRSFLIVSYISCCSAAAWRCSVNSASLAAASSISCCALTIDMV